MTIAPSFTDFLNPRPLPAMFTNAYPPSASLLVRAVPKSLIIEKALTVNDMIRSLRDNGLPVSAIAEIAKVERKTVYSWLDGRVEVQKANVARVETVYNLLVSITKDYRNLYRVWNRKLDHSISIRSLLCANDLSGPAIRDALVELSPAIKSYSERDSMRSSLGAGAGNPFIEEMPVAGISR